MRFQVPTFANPYSSTPISNAYAWIASLVLDSVRGSGQLTVYVHPDARSAGEGLPPLAQVPVALGQILTPADPVTSTPATMFPTLAQLMNDPVFASAYNTIQTKLYNALLSHPKFVGSTNIP